MKRINTSEDTVVASAHAGQAVSDSSTIPTSQLASRAYARYLERGGEHGRDVEDWLQAERDLQNAHAALHHGASDGRHDGE